MVWPIERSGRRILDSAAILAGADEAEDCLDTHVGRYVGGVGELASSAIH